MPLLPRRKLPIDQMADTGDPGDVSATGAAVGDETAMDPLAALAPPSNDESGLASLLQPGGGQGADQGAPPTDGPMFGQALGQQVINPGDAALAQQGPDQGGMGDMGVDPEEEDAQMMQQMLDDPMTPPDQKAMIQQQLQLAARRRLAGL